MSTSYRLNSLNTVVSFLEDLYNKLDPDQTILAIRRGFPDKEEAQNVVNDFLDNVVIPLGEMKEVALQVKEFRDNPLPFCKRIDYANKRKASLTERTRKLFDLTAIGEIGSHVKRLKDVLETQAGIIEDARDKEKSVSKYSALDRKLNMLDSAGIRLFTLYPHLNTMNERFDIEFPPAGVQELFDLARRIDLGIPRVRQPVR